MDKMTIPTNLRRIRGAKNLSQKKIADKAGISLSTYSNIENGRSVPRVDTLISLANSLEVNLKQLVEPVKIPKAVRFRAGKKIKSRSQILAQAGRWLIDYNYLEKVNNEQIPYLFQAIQRANIRKDDIDTSKFCRKKLGLSASESINDICGLLEKKAGIKIYPFKLNNNKLFGFSISDTDGGPAIAVNISENISVERWIFTTAHELGHLLLHINSFDINKTDEEENEEKEANIFASYLLMPNEGFLKKWDETYGMHPVDRILKVKKYFKVSYQTVLFRLHEMNSSKINLFQWFATEYKKRYNKSLAGHKEPIAQPPQAFSVDISEPFRNKEPQELSNSDFSESRLSRLVRKALEAGSISSGRGAEILNLSLEEMRNLANSWIVCA